MSRINIIFLSVACIILLMGLLVAVINMILRPFGHPLTGSFELMGYGSAIITALGLGFSQEKKSHIAVDILFKKFPSGLKKWLNIVGLLLCTIFFSAVAVRLFLFALDLKANGELSETLMVPFYPVTMIVSLGFVVLTLNLIHDIFALVNSRGRKG